MCFKQRAIYSLLWTLCECINKYILLLRKMVWIRVPVFISKRAGTRVPARFERGPHIRTCASLPRTRQTHLGWKWVFPDKFGNTGWFLTVFASNYWPNFTLCRHILLLICLVKVMNLEVARHICKMSLVNSIFNEMSDIFTKVPIHICEICLVNSIFDQMSDFFSNATRKKEKVKICTGNLVLFHNGKTTGP